MQANRRRRSCPESWQKRVSRWHAEAKKKRSSQHAYGRPDWKRASPSGSLACKPAWIRPWHLRESTSTSVASTLLIPAHSFDLAKCWESQFLTSSPMMMI